jgi:hypothetical protein
MADVRITLHEDGSLEVKTHCERGEEETSLDEIRELLDEIADVGDFVIMPPKPDDKYAKHKTVKKTGSETKDVIRRGDE